MQLKLGINSRYLQRAPEPSPLLEDSMTREVVRSPLSRLRSQLHVWIVLVYFVMYV